MNLFDPTSLWIAIRQHVVFAGIGVCLGGILGVLFSHLVLSQQYRTEVAQLRNELASSQTAFETLVETHDAAATTHTQTEAVYDRAMHECEKRAARCAATPVPCVGTAADYACYQDKKLAALVMRLGVSCAISGLATRDLLSAGQQK